MESGLIIMLLRNILLHPREYKKLNYDQTEDGNSEGMLTRAHDAPWEVDFN